MVAIMNTTNGLGFVVCTWTHIPYAPTVRVTESLTSEKSLGHIKPVLSGWEERGRPLGDRPPPYSLENLLTQH